MLKMVLSFTLLFGKGRRKAEPEGSCRLCSPERRGRVVAAGWLKRGSGTKQAGPRVGSALYSWTSSVLCGRYHSTVDLGRGG